MGNETDIHKLIADVIEHDRRMTAAPWRPGAVEKGKVFVPCTCCMGPERVLLTMNPHFEYDADAVGIAAYRTAAPRLATELRDALAERDNLNRSLKADRCDRRGWGAAFCDALSDLDQLRKERDEARASLRDAIDALSEVKVSRDTALELLESTQAKLRDALDREQAMQEALEWWESRNPAGRGALIMHDIRAAYALKLAEISRGR